MGTEPERSAAGRGDTGAEELLRRHFALEREALAAGLVEPHASSLPATRDTAGPQPSVPAARTIRAAGEFATAAALALLIGGGALLSPLSPAPRFLRPRMEDPDLRSSLLQLRAGLTAATAALESLNGDERRPPSTSRFR